MPIMPTRVNRVPRLGQPASYATPDSQTYGYDAGLPPSPSGSIPSLSNSHQSQGIPQGDAFGLMPGRTGSRARNFPAIGTGVLAGSNGVRNQGSLNAGQGVTAIPTQQPSYVARPADNPFPYEHDYGTGNSQKFDVSMQNLRDRQRSANSLLQRNIGAGGYGGIGGMSDGAAARQAELVNPLVAANQLQQQRNNYGSWERGQLRLGGAKQPDIVQAQGSPTLPTTSQFYAPRGVNRLLPTSTMPGGPDAAAEAFRAQREAVTGTNGGEYQTPMGTTVIRNGNGSRLVGSGLSENLFKAGFNQNDLIPGSPRHAEAMQALGALTSQAENARVAAQTAAGGGLSRAGQYDQRQKDIKALRYAKQRPTSLAFREAMGRVQQKQDVLAQQSKERELALQQKLQQDAFVRQQQQAAWQKHLESLPADQRAKALQSMMSGASGSNPLSSVPGGLPELPPQRKWSASLPDYTPLMPSAAPPQTHNDAPIGRPAMPGFGTTYMPGRRWGGY